MNLISADKLKPSHCLDCGNKLRIPYLVHEVICGCGAKYVWSYDETHRNGGIWKRKHILPLFDDNMRIETKEYLKIK